MYVTVDDPLLYARDVPTFVAEPITGASGTSGIGINAWSPFKEARDTDMINLSQIHKR